MSRIAKDRGVVFGAKPRRPNTQEAILVTNPYRQAGNLPTHFGRSITDGNIKGSTSTKASYKPLYGMRRGRRTRG